MNDRFLDSASRAARVLVALALAGPAVGAAQNFDQMIRQQMDQMNRTIAQGQQQVQQVVAQRMQDPQVRAAYQQYLARARAGGRPTMDFPTYTYNYIYTRGFSPDGVAHARANEANIAQREQQAIQGWREAQARRGQAQQGQRDSYFANQQEAGRGLMGQSTYSGAGGWQTQLPHTWQANTRHEYQGNTYHVDQSGRYYVRGVDGWWYPLQR
jgi:hypothetical protein